MLKDQIPSNYENRNLSEVFKELQAMQLPNSSNNVKINQKTKKHNNKIKTPKFKSKNHSFHINTSFLHTITKLGIPNILLILLVFILGIATFSPKNNIFAESYAKEEVPTEASEYELNRHRLNVQNIISENSGMDRVKEQVEEERDVEFETTYNNNPSLPKGEEIVIQEGALGKDKVNVVKTYENGTFVEEIILKKENIQAPVQKIIDLGTSEFLAKHKVHLGDTMYLLNDVTLKSSTESNATDVAEIKKNLDVKLLELPSEEWCKVSFDGIEGYMQTKNLTSAYTTPSIVEKNRIQRILIKVNIDMELNKTSGLTLNDYKKIFTGISNDTNKIFEQNYDVFYNIEKKYNINGIFLASMAIHESAWGTSQIAKDKNNLFGYGSYDETPYESSFEFESYEESIETVAKSLVKYYLNPSGTKIYDGETASAWYYNGPTLQGVNTRYASDKDWYKKVYSYMEMLYNRLN